ncbi:MAG: preprotein translocase subunit SecE [bacterium]
MTKKIKKAIEFLKEVKIELRKTTWPNRHEVISSTIVVLIATFFVTFFLWVCDISFDRLIRLIIK